MADTVHGDKVHGDKVGRDKIVQKGRDNTLHVNSGDGPSGNEFTAAVAELRAFVGRLTAAGYVAEDGSVTDPAAVVAAVQKEQQDENGGLRALVKAVAGGAKDAVLGAVKDGVAALVVALLGGPS